MPIDYRNAGGAQTTGKKMPSGNQALTQQIANVPQAAAPSGNAAPQMDITKNKSIAGAKDIKAMPGTSGVTPAIQTMSNDQGQDQSGRGRQFGGSAAGIGLDKMDVQAGLTKTTIGGKQVEKAGADEFKGLKRYKPDGDEVNPPGAGDGDDTPDTPEDEI